MDTFFRFLYDFLSAFFSGFVFIFKSFWEGLMMIFDIPRYSSILNFYKEDFSGAEWIFVVVSIMLVIIVIGLIGLLLYLIAQKYIRVRKSLVEQEELLEEVGKLNQEVGKLMSEKEKLLALKVSQLGVNPNEEEVETEEEEITDDNTRFSKLNALDNEYRNYTAKNYDNSFTLTELVHNFQHFAAYYLGLYYKEELIRLFIASLSSTKLVILQGISGTGKTSLAYAWGKFLQNDSCVASVQPSWRDRTELFGYFNEFTKKFNETDVLREIYKAGYTDDVHTIILDEMNIARVEYYFAEMLSILEMPNRDEWIVELVSSQWPTDPKFIKAGKLKIAPNVWYIGTINNDDSTFMVTDKVYDRAMPIDINEKGQVFNAEDIPAQNINYSYLEGLFEEALAKYEVSEETLNKVEEMDDFVINHFRIAFGNRIVAHMKKFVPVYMACGGDEIDGVDYFIAKKILRKFEQLNVAYIRDEIDNYIEFLDKLFGKGRMKECQEFLLRLKRTI